MSGDRAFRMGVLQLGRRSADDVDMRSRASGALLTPPRPAPRTLKRALDLLRKGAAVIVYEQPSGEQGAHALPPSGAVTTIGRSSGSDVSLVWDPQVSRAHCTVIALGGRWAVEDHGLSSNGTFVSGRRVNGQQILTDGDVIVAGATALLFRAPASATSVATAPAAQAIGFEDITPAQRRVLDALCRPLLDDPQQLTPASNRQIADELFLSVETVKDHLRALAGHLELAHLGQNERRLAIADFAVRSRLVR